MTKRKYKMTGCARFFLILIIIIPLAYMAASYINGQDGWANLKGIFQLEWLSDKQTDSSEAKGEKMGKISDDEAILDLETENNRLRQALEAARDSIRELQELPRDSI